MTLANIRDIWAYIYVPQPDAGHDTSWWPTVKDAFESFTRAHPRAPLPDTLTWEVADTKTWNRAHWLVIDSLGSTPGDAKDLPDLNLSGNVRTGGALARERLAQIGRTPLRPLLEGDEQ